MTAISTATLAQYAATATDEDKEAPDDNESNQTKADWPFRFLDLPPELRNRCYSFVLTASSLVTGPGVFEVNHPAADSIVWNNDS